MRAVNNHRLRSVRYLLLIFAVVILLILLQHISFYRTKSAAIYYRAISGHNLQQVYGWFKRQSVEYCKHLSDCSFTLERYGTFGKVGSTLLDVRSGISNNYLHSANDFSSNKRNDEKSLVGYLTFSNILQATVDNFSLRIADTHLWITTRFSVIVPQPYQTIVLGMVLGKGGYLSETLSHSIETMGIQHIFSVSGANFTVLASMLAFPLQRLPRRKQVLIIAVVSTIYTLLVGKQFPVIRACAMYLYNLIGRSYLNTQARPLFGLTIWVGVVLFWFPESLDSISFQLTVAATLGILVSYRPILGLSARLLEGKTALLHILDPVLLGTAVFLFVAPVLSLHFAEVSFAGVFYTAALFWLVELVSVVGFATLGYICISTILLGTGLLGYSDAIVGLAASLSALPLVVVLQWGTDAPSFSVPAGSTLQLFLWIFATGVLLHRLFSWWFFPTPKVLSIARVQKQYEKNLRFG